MKQLTIALCMFAICACAGAEVFRRDADYITWFLELENAEFEITTIKSGVEHSRTKGRIVDESPQMVLFEDSKVSDQPSVVHGKRLFIKQHEGISFLVEETRLSAFEEAKCIQDEFLRNVELTNFFRHGPPPRTEKKEPNSEGSTNTSQPTPGS